MTAGSCGSAMNLRLERDAKGENAWWLGDRSATTRSMIKCCNFRMLLIVVALLFPGIVNGFTLIGPGSPLVNPTSATFANVNMATDPMSSPRRIKEFYRWHFPVLTYAYDSTFVRFFGHNGMNAVSNSFRILNDYFEPEDKGYSGVSHLKLIEEYDGHFKTWFFNPSANVGNVTDMQSMTLGLLVNHLGLGNPHRACYMIEDIIGLNLAAGAVQGTFQIGMRNYDPYTYRPATSVNGVQYSYYITSNSPNNAAAITIFDAIEYAVSSDEEFTAIAAIRDVINFGGLAWPTVAPTVFRTPGVYFGPEDSKNLPVSNAMLSVNRTQPRHTLTFDDAGGLRYLYRTNNIIWESLDPAVTLVTPSNMNPPPITSSGLPPPVVPNQPFLTPQRRTIIGVVASGFVPTIPASSSTIRPANTTIIRDGLRGGIDKIRFTYTPFDSLLGRDYRQQSYAWTDTFITNALPTDPVPATPPYFTQVVQRTVTRPDIIFIGQDLGVVGNVLPVITVPNNASWSAPNALNTQQGNAALLRGPGSILLPAGASIQYIFTTRAPFYQVIWAGEPGIEGNSIVQFQWGWITGTGPGDYITFPEVDITQPEAITGPSGETITIEAITVRSTSTGNIVTYPGTIDRSDDRVYLYANRTDTTTEIHVLDTAGTTVNQVIPAKDYIVSDQMIIIPTGVFDNNAVGANKKIRLVNPKGNGASTVLALALNDGIPIIKSTQYDGLPLNTRKSLIINGSGFNAGGVLVDRLEFFDVTDTLLSRFTVPAVRVLSDSQIVITVDDLSAGAYATGLFGAFNNINTDTRSQANSGNQLVDAFTRKIRVRRGIAGPQSAIRPRDHAFTHVGPGGDTAVLGAITPTITAVTTSVGAANLWARGTALDTLVITGMGLDIALSIEFVDGDGNLIQATDILGNPPAPISLRSPIEPSALATGVTIANVAGDSYTITINPVTFGINGNSIFDSASGNNVNTFRRAVIRTPFGTAIATLGQQISITP